MLIEFACIEHDYNSHTYNYPYVPNKEQLFTTWVDNVSSYDNKFQLIDIPDELLFGILVSGFPAKCKLYYVFNYDKFCFATSKYEIYNNMTKNTGYGLKSSVNVHVSIENDFFDYGDTFNENSDVSFYYEVPDDCNEDFKTVVQPFIDYKFQNNIVSLCSEIRNHVDYTEKPVAIGSVSEYKSERFRIRSITTSDFFHIIYEMHNGTKYKEFDEKYPGTTRVLNEVLVGLQNYFCTTQRTDYDPRTESK